MTQDGGITRADERKLLEYINGARQRLVYVAPGVSDVIAGAIASRRPTLDGDALTVILDADPEVCRLGYGTIEGLKRLREALGPHLSHQPGVRIGLVIADNRMIIFSPTPLLIEAGSDAPERPNAIELTEIPLPLLRDTGLGPAGISDRSLGLDPVDTHRIAEVEQDLRVAPPAKFDLARRIRVFTRYIQFVELEMRGCFISRKKVRIPSSLVGLARTEDIERKFHAHFDLVERGSLEVKDASDRRVSERSLIRRRADLKRRFLIDLPGYGSVLLLANKDRFIEAVETLRSDVLVYSEGIREELQKQIERSRAAVVEALFPAVKRNPPDEYTKAQPNPSHEYLRNRLAQDIEWAFGDATSLVSDMSVAVVFKDVAYEALIDGKFIEAARKAMPDLPFLHEEFDASEAENVKS